MSRKAKKAGYIAMICAGIAIIVLSIIGRTHYLIVGSAILIGVGAYRVAIIVDQENEEKKDKADKNRNSI